jgi:5-methylcytosine-specific restriction enzyme subunit McrC
MGTPAAQPLVGLRRIPIQNLYYLLCYAWNHLEQGRIVDVSRIPSTELVDLFALVLSEGVAHLARRGLEQGYKVKEDDLAGVRGRIGLLESSRKFLLQHGRAHCRFDELGSDTLANRIVKATLRDLLACDALDHDLKARTRAVLRLFRAVEDVPVSTQLFRQVQLHSNNRFYRFLLHVCELIHEGWLVDQVTGQKKFRDFDRDERKMARVFEEFLYNFLRIHRVGTDVRREQIGWRASSSTDPGLALLPRMVTDISLRQPGSRLIIDAKYYQETLSDYYDAAKLHSQNIYQLLSYVGNAQPDEGEQIEGMLIYPCVAHTLREDYVIQGHPIHIRTLDLNQTWHAIESELMAIVTLQ